MPRFFLSMICLSLVLLGGLVSLSGCNVLNRLNRFPLQAQEDKETAAKEETVFRVHPYVFIADFDVDQKLPIFRELEELPQRVCRTLELPEPNKIIKVYLFASRDSYQQFMKEHYPWLPERRAFFLAQPRSQFSGDEDLMVFTHWSEEIEQDLRHELTHALLHSVLKDVPLWLDEGLAEYFETPKNANGLHEQHLQKLHFSKNGPNRPNLKRLETLTEVKDMATAEYREAWAWVHFMLHGSPQARRVLLGYLQDLRRTKQPGLLQPRLEAAVPALHDSLINHVDRLKRQSPAWSAARLR